ncbi:MAG: sigma-70 family RNA polymerase sigma factor [Pyrinomonadaceae bacterium]
MNDVSQLLVAWSHGDKDALKRLTPLVYDELRRLAKGYLKRERSDHTLQATALVHEAYVRLVDQAHVDWKNRAQFFGLAAQVMRNILVDHARGHRAAKRGSGEPKLALDEAKGLPGGRGADIVALDEALQELAKLDPRKSRVIELRYFGGLSIEETAEVTEVSIATVRRDLRMAEAWLHRELTSEPPAVAGG